MGKLLAAGLGSSGDELWRWEILVDKLMAAGLRSSG